MKTDITCLDRRSLIKLTLDTSVATTRLPSHMVTLEDFPTWVELLGPERVLLRLRSDGRVDVMVGELYGGQYVIVHTTADMARDVELPAVPDDAPLAPSVYVPVAELWRLENLTAVTQ